MDMNDIIVHLVYWCNYSTSTWYFWLGVEKMIVSRLEREVSLITEPMPDSVITASHIHDNNNNIPNKTYKFDWWNLPEKTKAFFWTFLIEYFDLRPKIITISQIQHLYSLRKVE
jgi:hypothetical protein